MSPKWLFWNDVGEDIFSSLAAGDTEIFTSADFSIKDAVKLTDTLFVIVYKGDDNKCYAQQISISGGIISLGTAYEVSGSGYRVAVCRISDTQLLVSYQDAGDSYKAKNVILTVNGSSFTKGSVHDTGVNQQPKKIVAISSTKLLACYIYSSAPRVCFLNISGTTISSMSSYDSISASSGLDADAVKLSDGTVVVFYKDGSSLKADICDVSGSSPVMDDSPTTVVTSSSSVQFFDCSLIGDTIAVTYQKYDGSLGQAGAIPVTVNSNTISVGTETMFTESPSNVVLISSCAIGDTQLCITYRDNDVSYHGKAWLSTLNGSFGALTGGVTYNADTTYNFSIENLTANTCLVFYYDNNTGDDRVSLITAS